MNASRTESNSEQNMKFEPKVLRCYLLLGSLLKNVYLRVTWIYDGNVNSTKVPSYVRGGCRNVLRTCAKTKGTQWVPLGTAESIAESRRERYERTQGCRECIVEQSTHNFRSIGESLRVSLFRVSLDRERTEILVRSSEKLSVIRSARTCIC